MTIYIPDRRRLIAMEREWDRRDFWGPQTQAMLERDLISERRSLAACILRAEACCWDVSPADVKWAAEWVAADEGWQESWGKLPAEVSP